MSEASATGRRPGVFSRIFNALVGDAAPEGVDPALHRRALWVAFATCAWIYSVSFLLHWILFVSWLRAFLHTKCWWLMVLLTRLPDVGPPELFAALLIPVFIYAIVLKRNGARLPLAAVEIAAIALVAYVIVETISNITFGLTMGFVLVLMLLMARRRLRARVTSVLLGITFCLFLLMDIIGAGSHLHYIEVWQVPWFGSFSFSMTVGVVYSILWLPLAVALPISLLDHAPTPALRQRAERSWSLFWVFLLAASVVTVCQLARYTVDFYIFPGKADLMVGSVLLVIILWLYKTGQASRELLAFLILSLAGITVAVSTMLLIVFPGASFAASFTLGGIVALLLANDGWLNRAVIRAVVVLLINGVALGVWYHFAVIHLAKLNLYYMKEPLPGLIVKLASSWFVLLAITVGALLFAWWFVKPKEIEALMPWRKKHEAESDVVSP
jgi:hypothetical protein